METALSFIGDSRGLKIIDLCSGSGCVAIAIAANTRNCEISALEKSAAACEFLRQNILLNKVKVTPVSGDLFCPMGDGYDLIVSNPPYITSNAMESLQTEVTHEPAMALSGGTDGLAFYRGICEKWVPLLNPRGMLAVEIGYDQRDAVTSLFETAGLTEITCIKDYGGNNRVITGKKPD